MLKYLIIQTCDSATSFCHYDNVVSDDKLIDLDTLKQALLWSMKENLNVQFVLPDIRLPKEYEHAIDTIDSAKIASSKSVYTDDADIVVFNSWTDFKDYTLKKGVTYVIRTSFSDLQSNKRLLSEALPNVDRVNVVLTDAAIMTDVLNESYSEFLDTIAESVRKEYEAEHLVQLNILTDRLMLNGMNNCNAGWESITLAPNGNFYVCPAFYFDEEAEPVGSIAEGPKVKNQQLYQLDHAPICRNCDAWHCRRCVWLNKRLTLEVNTPSHEQCVTSHLERNASARLLATLKKNNVVSSEIILTEEPILDPIEKLLNS